MLEVDHITFSYGRHTVLNDITFDVAPGEILALTGANGTGKTTLLRVLACLLMQDSGSVRLDGVNPLLRPIKYRRGIGYLSEHCPLYSDMTVESYLTYRVRLKGERSMRVRKRVSEALGMCGLEEVSRMRIRLLSYGYRKRVGLADALVQHPKLLLLDDPLAGLDVCQRKKTAAVLTAASSRAAVIVAGHEINEMLDWCTRFLVLGKSRVMAMYRTSDYTRAELNRLLEQQMPAETVEEASP
ncbi:MAG: ABC transporter ATP-binding protein [bacterium]